MARRAGRLVLVGAALTLLGLPTTVVLGLPLVAAPAVGLVLVQVCN